MNHIDLLRNAIIGTRSRRDVPREYDIIEYIQASGKQYIDLNFKPQLHTGKTKIVVSPDEINGTIGLWGMTSIVNATDNISLGIKGLQWFFGSVIDTVIKEAELDTKVVITFDRKNKTISIDDTIVDYACTENILDANLINAFLFARNGGDSTYGTNFSGKIYEYIEYDSNDRILTYLKPVQHKYTNTYGFYDIVNRVFVSNSGAGEFNEPPPITEEYIELEYITFNDEQWIDTKLSNTGDYIFEGEFSVSNLGTGSTGDDGVWVIGGRVNPDYALGIFVGTKIAIVYGYGGTTTPTMTPAILINKWYYLYFSMTTLIVGDYVYRIKPGNVVPLAYETNILLGKNQVNWAGTGNDDRNFVGDMKAMTIRNRTTNAVLRQYIPVRGSVSGKVGMFDTSNNKFIESSGPEEFIAGPDKI